MEILFLLLKEVAEFLLSGGLKWLWRRRQRLLKGVVVGAPSVERLPGERLVVTVFAEAEFRDECGSAGWAAWWRVNDTMLQQSGFVSDLTSRQQAELLALCRGIELVVKVAGVRPSDLLVVESSSRNAVQLISGEVRLGWLEGGDCRSVLRRIHAMVRRRKLDVRVKHVPEDGTATREQSLASQRCKQAAHRMLTKYLERAGQVADEASAAPAPGGHPDPAPEQSSA